VERRLTVIGTVRKA